MKFFLQISLLTLFSNLAFGQAILKIDDALKISSSGVYLIESNDSQTKTYNNGATGSNVTWDFSSATGTIDTLNIFPKNGSDTINWSLSNERQQGTYVLYNSKTNFKEELYLPRGADGDVNVFNFPLRYKDSVDGNKPHGWSDYMIVDGWGKVKTIDTTYRGCLRVKTYLAYADISWVYVTNYYYLCKGVGTYVAKIENIISDDQFNPNTFYLNTIKVLSAAKSKVLPNSALNPNPIFHPLTIKNPTNFKNEIKVFPNPAQNSIQIEFNSIVSGNLVVRNILGEIAVSAVVSESNNSSLNTENLEAGVYFLSFENGEGIITKSILIQHN